MTDERAVPLDDLLAHRQWVRALARRLAADVSSADDLEQATWLAAVEHPPRDARSVRGWLGTVLRNLHRNSLRGDARRGEREKAAPRRDPPPSADELVAEAETQHLLVRCVLDLDEPYRSAVLLRWYEDLTPTQIAARLGEPLDTVKTRLRRAVEQLRARMDARHGGDRRAWCLLAMGKGHGGAAGPAGSTAAAAAAEGVAMAAGTKALIAAVALIALGGWWWSTREDAPAPPGAVDSAKAAPRGGGARREREARDAAASDVPPASSAGAAAADRDLDLSGVIVRADGSPVAGASVQAVDYPWRRTMTMNFSALFEAQPGQQTTSDAAGEFRLRLRRGEARVLRAAATGLATLEMGPFQAGERVRLVLTSAVTLHVAVRDESGAPVAGAKLWLVGFGNRGDQPWVNEHGASDAAGKCAFAGLPGGAQVMVLPQSGAGDWGMSRTALPAEGEMTLDLVSPAGRTLRGRVFDAVTLAPVTQARIGLGKATICATAADGGGRFELRGFSGKSERDLAVSAPGYASRTLPVPEGDDPIDVPLRRGFAVSGRVVDAESNVLPGVRVAVETSQRGPGGEQTSCGSATTGADGCFRVDDLDPSLPHALSAFADGRGRARKLVVPRAGADAVDAGDIRLGAPRAVEGVVLHPDGTPWPGVEVRLEGPEVPQLDAATTMRARETRRTDDLGRFRFADLSAGSYSVAAQFPNEMPQPVAVALPADRDATDLVLPPRPSADAIAVQVVDDAGAPIPHTIVLGRGSQHEELCRVETDDAGRGRLRRPSKGKLTRLLVGAPIPGPWLISSEVPIDLQGAEQRLVVERGAYVPVQVLDADGRPIEGARLIGKPQERAIVWHGTDAEGRTQAIVPRQGAVSIVFSGTVFRGLGGKSTMEDALLEARQDGVTAQTGEVVLRCRRVETGRKVTVRVLAADGAPLADVLVALAGGAANFHRQATTDADGRASFDDLTGRELVALTAGRMDSIPPKPLKFVPDGQVVDLQCPAGVKISGSLRSPDGRPGIGGTGVNVLRGDTRLFQTSADADGRFVVQVPVGDPGPFRVQAPWMSNGGIVWSEREFTPADRDLVLELTK